MAGHKHEGAEARDRRGAPDDFIVAEDAVNTVTQRHQAAAVEAQLDAVDALLEMRMRLMHARLSCSSCTSMHSR